MKIKERIKIPQEDMMEILKSLGYREYRTDKINFVRQTAVGRIHIILIKDRKNSILLQIHHDLIGGAGHDHYTRKMDGTSKKAWNEIQNKIYDLVLENERNSAGGRIE